MLQTQAFRKKCNFCFTSAPKRTRDETQAWKKEFIFLMHLENKKLAAAL